MTLVSTANARSASSATALATSRATARRKPTGATGLHYLNVLIINVLETKQSVVDFIVITSQGHHKFKNMH